jgi:hypothetical protein
MKKQANKKDDDLTMSSEEFDSIMRKATQVSLKSIPKREKVTRKPKAEVRRTKKRLVK